MTLMILSQGGRYEKTKIIASQQQPKFTSTKMKDNKTKTIQKTKPVPLITEKRLQGNRELLIGQKIKLCCPGYGGAIGTVKKYSVSNAAYYLTYSDGHHEWIPFLECTWTLAEKLVTI